MLNVMPSTARVPPEYTLVRSWTSMTGLVIVPRLAAHHTKRGGVLRCLHTMSRRFRIRDDVRHANAGHRGDGDVGRAPPCVACCESRRAPHVGDGVDWGRIGS